MQENMNDTLTYYNQNAPDFIHTTQTVDFHEIQALFLSYLPDKSRILDLGCGSGRDAKYFMEQGYQVEATDGSEELCRAAEKYLGIAVKQQLFLDLDDIECYDGIWACASILHLKKAELPVMLGKIRAALKKNGICYTSFKYGTFEGMRKGRYFTDLTEESFSELAAQVNGLKTEKLWLTDDVRKDRGSEQWLNIIFRKVDIP